MCFTRATKTLYLKLLLHRKQKADTKVQELHFDFTQQDVNTLRNQWKPIDCQQLEKSECRGQWMSLRHRREEGSDTKQGASFPQPACTQLLLV